MRNIIFTFRRKREDSSFKSGIFTKKINLRFKTVSHCLRNRRCMTRKITAQRNIFAQRRVSRDQT